MNKYNERKKRLEILQKEIKVLIEEKNKLRMYCYLYEFRANKKKKEKKI